MEKNAKYMLMLIAFTLGTLTTMAQLEKNYIYIFDCTGSMRNNGLWETAQTALDNNISLRASIPGTHFSVIPFGDNPYEPFAFSNSEYIAKKSNITKSFDTYIHQAKFTNISDALKSGFSHVNPNKENEIYLFTDGMPEGSDTPQKVAQTINEWCANHRKTKLFYVALTKGVINSVIRQAIDACPDASIVQCENGIVPVITDISSDIYTNLEELDSAVEMSFSIPGNLDLTSSASDDLFQFNIVDNKASNGTVRIRISPKGALSIEQLHQTLQGGEYEFPATIQCEDSRFVIANPIVNVHILDEVPSKLTIAQGVDELHADGVKWHDSFLWSDAVPERKVVWDLTPVFKNELQSSRLGLKFQVADGQSNDFHAWYNGEPISNGSTIRIVPNQPAVLEVQFNHDAVTGMRYFSLVPTTVDCLDFINEQPNNNYNGTSLRTDYKVGWNPLKTFMFGLFIVLLAVLILWFVILKQIFFPVIKMGMVTLTGPGTYYASKKIKGARKVVLTSKRKTQNIFSRFFTGEIRFIKADHFTHEMSIVPAGCKKKVKLRSEGKSNNPWEIYPASIFDQYDTGSLTNRTTNENSEIEFS